MSFGKYTDIFKESNLNPRKIRLVVGGKTHLCAKKINPNVYRRVQVAVTLAIHLFLVLAIKRKSFKKMPDLYSYFRSKEMTGLKNLVNTKGSKDKSKGRHVIHIGVHWP